VRRTMAKTAQRRVTVVDNRPLARRIGTAIRQARLRAGLTQAEVARGRYTSAYISALERGLAKPSMAALTFISERLGVPVRQFLAGEDVGASRLEADLLLAAGDSEAALDRYETLLPAAVDRRIRAELLRGIAEALCRLERGGEAVSVASEAVELLQAMGRHADAAYAAYWLGYAHYQQENLREARAILESLLKQVRDGLDVLPDFRFRLLTALANVEAWDGEHQRALAYLEEARVLTADLDLRRRATFLAGLTNSYRESGDYEAAITTGTQSLALFRAAESERDVAALSNNLALTFLKLGNLERAAEFIASAAEAASNLADHALMAHIVETQAQVLLAQGRYDDASERAAEAQRLAEVSGNHHALASALMSAAHIAGQTDRREDARGALEAAIREMRDHGPASGLMDALGELAQLHAAAGDLVKANALYAEALAIRRS
jgi:tetratricopeptide (TPR) repeat protein